MQRRVYEEVEEELEEESLAGLDRVIGAVNYGRVPRGRGTYWRTRQGTTGQPLEQLSTGKKLGIEDSISVSGDIGIRHRSRGYMDSDDLRKRRLQIYGV